MTRGLSILVLSFAVALSGAAGLTWELLWQHHAGRPGGYAIKLETPPMATTPAAQRLRCVPSMEVMNG